MIKQSNENGMVWVVSVLMQCLFALVTQMVHINIELSRKRHILGSQPSLNVHIPAPPPQEICGFGVRFDTLIK